MQKLQNSNAKTSFIYSSSSQNTTGQQNYAGGYANNYAQYPNQLLGQHMIDSALEGTLYGIMEVKKMMFNILFLPDGTAVTVPYEDTQYEFYVKIPINLSKYIIYKIRPFVKERIMIEKKEQQMGYCAILPLETIDNESELPALFTYTPIKTMSFKITNARQSLNDDTYRFWLDDQEVVTMHDSQEDAYINIDLSSVLPMLNEGNACTDLYEAEYKKYLKRVAKRFNVDIGDINPIYNAVCVGNHKANNNSKIAIELYKNCESTHDFAAISYNTNQSAIGDHIVLESELQQTTAQNYNGRMVCLQYGEALKGKEYYKILSIGGEIVALDKM